MAARRLSTRATKERQVSNRRKHSSGVSGLGSCVRGQRAKSRVTDLLVCLGLVAVTWAVFGQTIRYHFVNFDDDLYVYNIRSHSVRADTERDNQPPLSAHACTTGIR